MGNFKIWRFEKSRVDKLKYKHILEDLLKLVPDKFEQYKNAHFKVNS